MEEDALSKTTSLAAAWLGKTFSRGKKALELAQGLVDEGRKESQLMALEYLKNRVEPEAMAQVFATTVLVQPKVGSLSEEFQKLLNQSTEQNKAFAQQVLFKKILEQLTPDEARLLSALSDGSSYPVVDVYSTALVGWPRLVLANLSSMGRDAGAVWMEATSYYLAHLAQCGLLQFAGEEERFLIKYQILEGSSEVLQASKAIKTQSRRHKIIRKTVLLSPLGRQFWQACQPALGIE